MNMICKKCESRINSGAKCFQCGHDNNSVMPASASPAKYKRSPALIAVMSLFILVSTIIILSMTGMILRIPPLANMMTLFSIILGISSSLFFFSIPGVPVHYMILAVITMAAAVLDIVLCIGIIRLKKSAFKAYIRLTVVGAVLRVLSIINVIIYFIPAGIFRIMFPYILKGFLLYIVSRTDVRHFGGTVLDESVSVKRARKRKEDIKIIS